MPILEIGTTQEPLFVKKCWLLFWHENLPDPFSGGVSDVRPNFFVKTIGSVKKTQGSDSVRFLAMLFLVIKAPLLRPRSDATRKMHGCF